MGKPSREVLFTHQAELVSARYPPPLPAIDRQPSAMSTGARAPAKTPRCGQVGPVLAEDAGQVWMLADDGLSPTER